MDSSKDLIPVRIIGLSEVLPGAPVTNRDLAERFGLTPCLVESDPKHFAPMNSNWGIVPELPGPPIRDKREKARLKGERALATFDAFLQQL